MSHISPIKSRSIMSVSTNPPIELMKQPKSLELYICLDFEDIYLNTSDNQTKCMLHGNMLSVKWLCSCAFLLIILSLDQNYNITRAMCECASTVIAVHNPKAWKL